MKKYRYNSQLITRKIFVNFLLICISFSLSINIFNLLNFEFYFLFSLFVSGVFCSFCIQVSFEKIFNNKILRKYIYKKSKQHSEIFKGQFIDSYYFLDGFYVSAFNNKLHTENSKRFVEINETSFFNRIKYVIPNESYLFILNKKFQNVELFKKEIQKLKLKNNINNFL